jgi:alpha-galactosidase
MNIINRVSAYVDRGAYGGWNDLDMLEVGLGGMTDEEYKVRWFSHS